MLLQEELDEAIEGEFACFAVEVEQVFERLHATYPPHCDFALHEVGSVLRDQISQGQADGD
jgi:hypothetical protein